MSAIALCVNPMSGRDVRRLAAKATNITPEAKRDAVARIAIGADAAGIKKIFYTEEPFCIASKALATLNLAAEVIPLPTPKLTHTAEDTDATIAAFLGVGATTIVSIGGDGTNRAIIRSAFNHNAVADMNLIPLSAGTNNAFPALGEPTIAGMTAALAAQNHLAPLRSQCKIIHLELPDGGSDIGLIDAAVLAQDSIGSLLPFECDKLRLLVLTRSDPAVSGMSSIGGLIEIVTPEDDFGLLLRLGGKMKVTHRVNALVAPGLFETVEVSSVEHVECDQLIKLPSSGVLAFDGDREYRLERYPGAGIRIKRDGPCVLDAVVTIRSAVAQGLLPKGLARKL